MQRSLKSRSKRSTTSQNSTTKDVGNIYQKNLDQLLNYRSEYTAWSPVPRGNSASPSMNNSRSRVLEPIEKTNTATISNQSFSPNASNQYNSYQESKYQESMKRGNSQQDSGITYTECRIPAAYLELTPLFSSSANSPMTKTAKSILDPVEEIVPQRSSTLPPVCQTPIRFAPVFGFTDNIIHKRPVFIHAFGKSFGADMRNLVNALELIPRFGKSYGIPMKCPEGMLKFTESDEIPPKEPPRDPIPLGMIYNQIISLQGFNTARSALSVKSSKSHVSIKSSTSASIPESNQSQTSEDQQLLQQQQYQPIETVAMDEYDRSSTVSKGSSKSGKSVKSAKSRTSIVSETMSVTSGMSTESSVYHLNPEYHEDWSGYRPADKLLSVDDESDEDEEFFLGMTNGGSTMATANSTAANTGTLTNYSTQYQESKMNERRYSSSSGESYSTTESKEDFIVESKEGVF